MKNREYLLTNIAIIMLILTFGIWTLNSYSKTRILNIVDVDFTFRNQTEDQVPFKVGSDGCSEKDKLDIDASSHSSLKDLELYQDLCSSFVTDSLMLFTIFPSTEREAIEKAEEIAKTLRIYSENDIKPIVIVEPYLVSGPMEYTDYLNGKYDNAVRMYFRHLQALGITDEQMGTWVPFPESNTPNWANKDTEPVDFSTAVNKYLRMLKFFFPEAKGSILLNAATFEPDDYNWENGDYLSLSQYTVFLEDDLVDSIGIQGFPWVSNGRQATRRTIYNAGEFLQPDIAIGVARELKTKDIWFNTGTFSSKYTNDPEAQVFVDPNERRAILDRIVETALYVKRYQQNEYRVSINLFAEDKSNSTEATDWSYMDDDESKEIFYDFVENIHKNDIELSIYSKERHP